MVTYLGPWYKATSLLPSASADDETMGPYFGAYCMSTYLDSSDDRFVECFRLFPGPKMLRGVVEWLGSKALLTEGPCPQRP